MNNLSALWFFLSVLSLVFSIGLVITAAISLAHPASFSFAAALIVFKEVQIKLMISSAISLIGMYILGYSISSNKQITTIPMAQEKIDSVTKVKDEMPSMPPSYSSLYGIRNRIVSGAGSDSESEETKSSDSSLSGQEKIRPYYTSNTGLYVCDQDLSFGSQTPSPTPSEGKMKEVNLKGPGQP